jgi:hypothetical protein
LGLGYVDDSLVPTGLCWSQPLLLQHRSQRFACCRLQGVVGDLDDASALLPGHAARSGAKTSIIGRDATVAKNGSVPASHATSLTRVGFTGRARRA